MTSHLRRRALASFVAAFSALIGLHGVAAAAGVASPFAHTVSVIASTVPPNGDLNPYGMAVVPTTMGSLVAGNILISNFNNSSNLQGTGSTIVQISPSGHMSVFAQIDPHHLPGQCPGGIGLTTALAATSSGWVFVGSLPTTDGTSGTARAGCVLVLNSLGQVVETFYGSLINGPWDLTALDGGSRVRLWVTNVLNGTVAGHGRVVNGGTVVRFDIAIPNGSMPQITSATVVASGLSEKTDPGALVIGPTGVALSPDHSLLYIADSVNSRIGAISNPVSRTTSGGIGMTLTMGGALNVPLGLTIAPNGDVLSANGADGFLVRTTPAGHQVRKDLLDSSGSPPGAGALFGLAEGLRGLYFVDDATNTLNLFH